MSLRSSGICCAARGCTYNNKKLKLWLDQECFEHAPQTKRECSCARRYRFYRMPAEEGPRRMWLQNLGLRNPPKTVHVCSFHFVDRMPTEDNPFPTLWLGLDTPERRRRIPEKTPRNPPDDPDDAQSQRVHPAMEDHTYSKVLPDSLQVVVKEEDSSDVGSSQDLRVVRIKEEPEEEEQELRGQTHGDFRWFAVKTEDEEVEPLSSRLGRTEDPTGSEQRTGSDGEAEGDESQDSNLPLHPRCEVEDFGPSEIEVSINDYHDDDEWQEPLSESEPELEDDDSSWSESRSSTSETDLPQEEGSTEGKPFSCDFCNKCFSQLGNLNIHMRVHTGEKPFRCNICGKGFSHQSNLSTHVRVHTGEKPFECAFCCKRFARQADVKRHTRVHTGEKPYGCDVCGKMFSQKILVRLHMSVHTGEKPFGCKMCGKRFSRKAHITSHMRVHTGEKPFDCTFCGKKFSRSTFLRSHMKVHTGDKPFDCDVCGKKFSHKTNLVSHTRVHTGERPYECDFCGKGYKERSRYTNHLRVHTGEKPFDCDICGETFRERRLLNRHMRAHTGTLQFECSFCGKSFRERARYTNHLRIHTH